MPSLSAAEQQTRLRNLHFLREPKLWPQWPFLALMRRRPGREEEYGVLYDALGASGRVGYSATVFLCLCGVPHKQSYADSTVMRTWWT
jgi:hypothetical protein